jgi:hypothetical protein
MVVESAGGKMDFNGAKKPIGTVNYTDRCLYFISMVDWQNVVFSVEGSEQSVNTGTLMVEHSAVTSTTQCSK